ncbi:unnamed protein product [Urochloa humidicola]
MERLSSSSYPADAGTSLPLPSPLPELGLALSAADLGATAYELLVAASRTTAAAAGGKPKGAFGLGSSASSNGGMAAVLELVRVRMGVTAEVNARIRRVLLRVAAGQVRITWLPEKDNAA